jgi:hypothetical protein
MEELILILLSGVIGILGFKFFIKNNAALEQAKLEEITKRNEQILKDLKNKEQDIIKKEEQQVKDIVKEKEKDLNVEELANWFNNRNNK